MAGKKFDVTGAFEKDGKLKAGDVAMLVDWVEKQPHLPKITELQVIIFLQSCNYSNEQAKITIDNFYTVKSLCPDIFGNRNPLDPVLQKAINVTVIHVMPKLTPNDQYCVNYMRLMDLDPEKFNLSHQIKYFDMVSMLHLGTFGQCHGYVLVLDMTGAVFGHLARCNVMVVKKLLYYLQEAMPVRLKGIHLLNIPSWIDKLVALLKPFMKKELFDMFYLHPEVNQEFLKYVPKECLPLDLGGACESAAILHEKTKQQLNDNADFFKEEDEQRVDETKRPGKPKNEGDFFGIEGTFKKLQVD